MKNKTFNPVITVALVIILLSSISFSQGNDNPKSTMKTHKKMSHKEMKDCCNMKKKNMMDPEHKKIMGKMKTHKKMDHKEMMDCCKMKKENMKDPEHKKTMGKMKTHKKMDHKEMMDCCKMKKKNMKDPEHKKKMGKMKNHMKMHDKSKMKTSMTMKKKNTMVHKGIIDLNSIDKNKDEFVYQDRMDWNVISDKPGTCPLCGMKLKKYSIEQARKNLIDKGFKVK